MTIGTQTPEQRIAVLRSDHPITPVSELHPEFGPIHRCSADLVRVHWITRSWRHDLPECTALFAEVYSGSWAVRNG